MSTSGGRSLALSELRDLEQRAIRFGRVPDPEVFVAIVDDLIVERDGESADRREFQEENDRLEKEVEERDERWEAFAAEARGLLEKLEEACRESAEALERARRTVEDVARRITDYEDA